MPVTRRTRRGFTLVELLITIVVFGIVMGALLKVVVGQQRFYHGAEEMIETQTNVRDAVNVLAGDLRGISASGNDIVDMQPTSIQFWAIAGASVVCQIGVGGMSITIPPEQLAANNGLTSWIRPPQVDDRLLIYDLGDGDASSNDKWLTYRLTTPPMAGGSCPNSTGFTTTAAEATAGYTLQLDHALDANIVQGSSIRIMHQVRYSLYQAADGRWYLGYQECPAGTCAAVQPVSGPYLPPSTTGPSGLELTYYDGSGAVTSTMSAVARIDVVTRAATRGDVKIPGLGSGRHVDSLSVSIAPRN